MTPRGRKPDVPEVPEAPEPGDGEAERPVTYCLIPRELADKLHEPLRRHFRRDPSVEVVVEHRHRERRRADERRLAEGASPTGEERRQIRATRGRRIGERRARLAPVAPRPLPRAARRHAEEIGFFMRMEPSTERLEDEDTARLVTRFQAGDREVYATLYSRYFERVYGYLRILFRDHHEAEDVTSEVFTQVLEALPGYERRRQPFRAWMFAIARNAAIARLRKLRRLEPTDPQELDERREREGEPDPAELAIFDWITDRDLSLFVERLPLPQRQVLVLRFMLDLEHEQIARVLGRSNDDVRILQHRALRFLEDRLTAIGRAPESKTRPAQSKRRKQQSGVLRLRRFMLE